MLLTNLIYFSAGLFSGLGLAALLGVTQWVLRALIGRHPQTGPAMTPEHPAPVERRRTPTWAWVLILCSLLVVAIGVQQTAYQAERDDRDAAEAARDEKDRVLAKCLATYNVEAERIRDVRIVANKALADAESAKAAALDRVVLVVLRARRVPPDADEADLDRALRRFARAKEHLDAVTLTTDTTLRDNAYPSLDC